ncbi:MAG: sigma-70 family RNA polymerase sigma factor [Gammaproteobacteria bacterium]
MASLNKETSRQDCAVIADCYDDKKNELLDNPDSGDDAESDCNCLIARELNKNKAHLVEVLSEFPVTALWLISRYKQQIDAQEADGSDEEVVCCETRSELSELKKLYRQAGNASMRKDAHYAERKRKLTVALKQFAYSFQDLTRLVNIIVFAYKLRSLNFQTTPVDSKINSNLVMKRLEGFKHRDNLNSSQFLDTVKTNPHACYDEQFLFLSAGEMHKSFIEIVNAEHKWLASRERLATANSRLVLFIANQYKGGFLDFEDLVQEGQTGLLKAVDKYDPRLGYKFSTYAGYWIRQAISRALSRCERVVRIPCGQIGTINKVFRAKEQLFSKLGKEPSVQEIAQFTQLPTGVINRLLSIAQTALPMEDSSEEESTFSPIDFLEQQIFAHPFKEIAQSDLEDLIRKALKLLSPREAKVICGHFGIQFEHEMTLKEIGSELNLTRERVRQIQVGALNKMKNFYGRQLLTCL